MAMSSDGQPMRAVVVDNAAAGKLVLRTLPAPQPGPSQALVRVAAISLNRGETRTALNGAADGWRRGWDLAGVIARLAHLAELVAELLDPFLDIGGHLEQAVLLAVGAAQPIRAPVQCDRNLTHSAPQRSRRKTRTPASPAAQRASRGR